MPDFNTINSGQDDMDNPASSGVSITTHDTTALTSVTRGVYVGGAGNITCRLLGSSVDVVFTAVPVGSLLPIRVSHVRATGTTATLLIALF